MLWEKIRVDRWKCYSLERVRKCRRERESESRDGREIEREEKGRDVKWHLPRERGEPNLGCLVKEEEKGGPLAH